MHIHHRNMLDQAENSVPYVSDLFLCVHDIFLSVLFQAVLNYLRTDELHLPSYMCGPAAKTELAFWGVPPSKIER